MPSILFVCLGNICRSPPSLRGVHREVARSPAALSPASPPLHDLDSALTLQIPDNSQYLHMATNPAHPPSAGNSVSATEFQTRAGLYIEQSGKAPVFITRHRRLARVLIDIEEYERLKARDTRQSYRTETLPDVWADALAEADYGPVEPALEALTK
jgi:prevent-host-death family protein